MTESQVLEKILPIYSPDFKAKNLLIKRIRSIEKKYNSDIKDAFLRASLLLLVVNSLKGEYPIVGTLFSYIAVETLSNNLAYFRETKGIKYTDFKIKHKIENKIGKKQEFISFLARFCPDKLKEDITMKKDVNDKIIISSFDEILHYLYQKNRSYIIHKGIFRKAPLIDIFLDGKGNKYAISMMVKGNNLTEWLYQVVQTSFVNFLNS